MKKYIVLIALVTLSFSQKQMTVYKNNGATFITSTDNVDSIVFSPGLVAEYKFDGNANDMSGNGFSGTVTGAELAADRFGNENRAYQFDGTGDHIDVGHPLGTADSNFSICVYNECRRNINHVESLSQRAVLPWARKKLAVAKLLL